MSDDEDSDDDLGRSNKEVLLDSLISIHILIIYQPAEINEVPPVIDLTTFEIPIEQLQLRVCFVIDN